jgi:hypothetical protein
MKALKIGCVASAVLFLSSSYCYSGEVDRGDIADKGTTVTKSRITFVPHAEIEYGIFSYETRISGGGPDNTGLALGLTVGKNSNMLDFYTRLSLGDEENSVNNYGIVYAHRFNTGKEYFSIALEKQDYKENGAGGLYWSDEYFSSSEIRIKPSYGMVAGGEEAFLMYGVGVYLGNAEIDYKLNEYSGVYEGSDTTTTYGIFVQSKFGYNITKQLALVGSLLWEGGLSTGIDLDANHSMNPSAMLWYCRLCLQYRF